MVEGNTSERVVKLFDTFGLDDGFVGHEEFRRIYAEEGPSDRAGEGTRSDPGVKANIRASAAARPREAPIRRDLPWTTAERRLLAPSDRNTGVREDPLS